MMILCTFIFFILFVRGVGKYLNYEKKEDVDKMVVFQFVGHPPEGRFNFLYGNYFFSFESAE
jgi:hypothetical protein